MDKTSTIYIAVGLRKPKINQKEENPYLMTPSEMEAHLNRIARKVKDKK